MLANIADQFINTFASFAAVLMGHIPLSTLPNTLIDYFNSGWSGASVFIGPAQHYVPVTQLMVALGGIYAIDVAIVGFNTFMFGYRRIWFVK